MGDLGLCVLSGLLFALAFPSPLAARGLGPLGFVFLLPALSWLRRARPAQAALGGFVFGLAGYGLLNWWLSNYDPLAAPLVMLLGGCSYGLLFVLLAFVHRTFPRGGWVGGALIWVGAEYLKTLGFLGYPFGVLGYSQYRFPALTQSASLFGVWAVSLVLLLPQFAFSSWWRGRRIRGLRLGGLRAVLTSFARSVGPSLLILALALLWGGWRLARSEQSPLGPSLRIALVQPLLEPHTEDPAAYAAELTRLIETSAPALAKAPDLVVWPETAFVPSIAWHERYRSDEEVWPVVKRCLDFIRASHRDFLIGNNQGELELGAGGGPGRVDYNAVLAFRGDRADYEVYRKVHLVPFSEYFPFERSFPRLYRFLEEREGSFWRPGRDLVALDTSRARVAVPICFEDGFGELTRRLAADDASLIVPVVNDVWSRSASAEMQHAACSVFRAVETGLPVARCTNSGLTCVISPSGRIETELAPFTQGVLVRDLRLGKAGGTLYSRIGDLGAQVAVLAGIAVLLFASLSRLRAIVRRRRSGREGRA